MDLIDGYLKRENSLDLTDDDGNEITDDQKLEFFFNLFIDLERSFRDNVVELNRLNDEHREEINELEKYVYQVKKLTEEREKLSIDFKDENDELKNKIKSLQRTLADHEAKAKNKKSLQSEISTDDELSEETVEILILEGFGNIVASPIHEILAVILADRRSLIEKLTQKKSNEKETKTSLNTSISSNIKNQSDNDNGETLSEIRILNEKIEILEAEIHVLKETNMDLTEEVQAFRASNELGSDLMQDKNLTEIKLKNEIIQLLNSEIEDLKAKLDASNDSNNKSKINDTKKHKSTLKKEISIDAEENSSSTEESSALIESSAVKFEISKLKEENQNLKLEMDKLYDEISVFEIENKQLKDDCKNYANELMEVNESLNNVVSTTSETKNLLEDENRASLDEIKKLKQEIEDLNNELDDLVQFKLNYERLKIDFDKLKNTLEETQMDLRIEQQEQFIKNSPRKSSNLTPSSSFNRTLNQDDQNKFGQANTSVEKNKISLELEWIRGENEKILLDLEKTQSKLNEKIAQCNDLKEQLLEKDEEMKEFISKYEKKETNNDDLLNLQSKILDLEHDLNKEREKHAIEIEESEERLKDLLKRNDHLWSQMTKLEQNYKDATEIIKNLNQDVEMLEDKLKSFEQKIAIITKEKSDEIHLKEKQIEINKNLEKDLANLKYKLSEINSKYDFLSTEKYNENEAHTNHINSLNRKIEELNETVRNLENINFSLKLDIDGLNKEKSFIMNQNESSQQKVIQDFLSLQEKHTSVSYQHDKLISDFSEMNALVKEKERLCANLEAKVNQLRQEKEIEINEKKELQTKLTLNESEITRDNEKLNDLSEKIRRLESHKAKLEIKAKELETLQTKYELLNNELNDKRDTLSQVLEKNGKLDQQISKLDRQLNETKHSLIQTEKIINELTHFKSETLAKSEEIIKIKHDFENEKIRREKAEQKIDELREECKKLKQRAAKLQDENEEIKKENVENTNQLQGVKSKLDFISDIGHTELEKNTALQDQLSETKKKLELTEMKCTSYSQKFDILLKRYETRKVKQKNKIERLWEYLQREREKYKELLANAQNDLNTTKSNFNDRESESRYRQENSAYHNIIEEKAKLVAEMVDKDNKIREMKRQNLSLNSRITYLEEEIQTLTEKTDQILKEKNKLRKELQTNLTNGPVSIEILDVSMPDSVSASANNLNASIRSLKTINSSLNLTRPISTDPIEKSFNRSTSFNYWNELNASSSWDVNYNTGYINKYNNFKDTSFSSKTLNTNGIKPINGNLSTKKDINISVNRIYGTSIANGLNSVASTPRSFM